MGCWTGATVLRYYLLRAFTPPPLEATVLGVRFTARGACVKPTFGPFVLVAVGHRGGRLFSAVHARDLVLGGYLTSAARLPLRLGGCLGNWPSADRTIIGPKGLHAGTPGGKTSAPLFCNGERAFFSLK